MTTIESNMLIAEFMGLGLKKTLFNKKLYERKEFTDFKSPVAQKTELYYPDELLYHFSWDWLMPVVAKIENTESENGDKSYSVGITKDWCTIIDLNTGETIEKDKNKGEDKINVTYRAVIEFIKWHNQLNK